MRKGERRVRGAGKGQAGSLSTRGHGKGGAGSSRARRGMAPVSPGRYREDDGSFAESPPVPFSIFCFLFLLIETSSLF